MAEKENAKSKDNIKTNNKTWIIVAIVAVAIVICAVIFSSKNSSLSSSQSNKTIDTYKEVEITPEEDYDDYYNSDGMIQHSEDQGQNIPGDDDPWNN